MGTFRLRRAHAADRDLLWRFLAIAAYEPNAEAARNIPVLAPYLAGWRRPGDFGVIAERDGQAIGACWARQFLRHEHPVFFAGPHVPEISIGVLPLARGYGVGTALLRHIETIAHEKGYNGLCLNVRDTNPAIRLYRRAGFQMMPGAEVRNRTGGLSLGMAKRF